MRRKRRKRRRGKEVVREEEVQEGEVVHEEGDEGEGLREDFRIALSIGNVEYR